MRKFFSVISILFCLTFVAADDELVESAIYRSWNRHGLDTTVTRDTKMNIGGEIVTARFVSKLVAKADNAVSLDDVITLDVAGKKQVQTSQRYVSSMVRKGREEMPESYDGVMTSVGTEVVQIGGKPYECRILYFDGRSPQGKSTGKFWMNDDVPGLVVKAQIQTSSSQGEVDVEMIVTAFELK